jgi:hypothetical protein
MLQHAYDTSNHSTDYLIGGAAELGNYIAESYINFGLQDGSNEQGNYAPAGFGYMPVNGPLIPGVPGPQGLVDLNRWQPLSFQGNATPFLGPHWGRLAPFALTDDDLVVYERDDTEYFVYHDPGAPPYIDLENNSGIDDDYKWTFALVAVWSGFMDPNDPTMIDISPASFGNLTGLPANVSEMREFYDLLGGGVHDEGYALNPHTGLPYEPQIVPRGDFVRVLAEFWADGPSSETPPGHWFTILNYVSDHPLFEKRFKGEGPVLDDLEWDVKSYFALGGAMHDVAVAVWGIKSWYDYVRPISAIRGMAALGQSTDSTAMSYHPGGMPLIPGHIELVLSGDPLAGESDEHVGKVKLFAWRGPGWIGDPLTDYAGCGWILAEEWWPYQRPGFVTPPFAGYISGHSTFSRAAAETLTMLTGDEYFPGGMGEFHAPQNAYLVFEAGPSVDMTLQWAKYRDASDQSSESRIWGGIHPPVDDIPGRRIGAEIAEDVFVLAEEYFTGGISSVRDNPTLVQGTIMSAPNPVMDRTLLTFSLLENALVDLSIMDLTGRAVAKLVSNQMSAGDHAIAWNTTSQDGTSVPGGIYVCRLLANGQEQPVNLKIVVVR